MTTIEPAPRHDHQLAHQGGFPRFEVLTFAAVSLEGMLALAVGLLIPSEQQSSVVLGYSLGRLTLFTAALAGVLVPAILAMRAGGRPGWFYRTRSRIQLWLAGSDRAYWILFASLTALGISAITATFYFMYESYLGSTERALLQRAWPFILWFSLGSLHASSLVARLSWDRLTRDRELRAPRLTTSLAILGGVFLSFAHWLTLRYDAPVLTSIPGWFWRSLTWYGFTLRLYLPIILAVSGAAYLFTRFEWRRRYALPLLIGFSLALQLSVGFVRGGGIESLRQHYLTLGQSEYAEYVADDDASIEDVLHYDESFANSYYLGTKPPGYILPYLMVRAVSDAAAHASTYRQRFTSITTIITVSFPIVASLALLPIYELTRLHAKPQVGRIACVLYATAPSFILMTPRLDQVLFPLLFATGLLLATIAFRNRDGKLAFAAGAFAYCSIYFSFTLIPLLVLCAVYLLIAQLRVSGRAAHLARFNLLFWYTLGVVIAVAVLARFLNFDIVSRFTNAMTIHTNVIGTGSIGLSNLSDLVLNNIEFGSWIGSAMVLLLAAGILAIARVNKQQHALSLRPLLLAGSVTYLMLNAFGQSRGETGRLWLFLLPLVVVIAAHAIQGPNPRVPKLVALIGAVQVATALLILQYQFAA